MCKTLKKLYVSYACQQYKRFNIFFAFETSAVYEIQPFFLTLLGLKKLQCVFRGSLTLHLLRKDTCDSYYHSKIYNLCLTIA